jgi:hypothetical protein
VTHTGVGVQEGHLEQEHAAKGPQPAPASVVDRIESRVWTGSKATTAAGAAAAAAANTKGKGKAEAGASPCRRRQTDEEDKEECYVCLDEFEVGGGGGVELMSTASAPPPSSCKSTAA